MTDQLVRQLHKGLGKCNELQQHIDYLVKLAEAAPQFEGIARELKAKYDNMKTLCEVGVEMARAMKG